MKNLTLDGLIEYAQEAAADNASFEAPGSVVLALLLELRAARPFIDAAQELSMDLGEIQFCPICDGDCAESHTDDCTFAKSEALLNAYVKVVQK